MKLAIACKLDNAAFDEYGPEEVRRILMSIADNIAAGVTSSRATSLAIRDINGNKIGSWKITK